MARGVGSPEAAFVVTSCREDAPAADLEAARDTVRDWDRVVGLARANGVAGLVLRGAARLAVELPDTVEPRLREVMTESVAFVLALDAQLGRVATSLEREVGPVLVLKGRAVAATFYPDPALRPYNDIDLLAPPGSGERAAATLLRMGFTEEPFEAEVARRRRAPRSLGSFHRLFVDPARRTLVELHSDSLQIGIWPCREEDRWRRARPLPTLPAALMLAPEDQLLQLAVHIHRHGLSRLIWLKDIDLLLRTQRLDWDLIVRDARSEGVTGSIWLAIEAASRVLEAPRPPAIRRLAPAPPVRALYEVIWPLDRVRDLTAAMRRRGVQFHAAESWRGTIPSLVLMGRRAHRIRAIASYLIRGSAEPPVSRSGG